MVVILRYVYGLQLIQYLSACIDLFFILSFYQNNNKIQIQSHSGFVENSIDVILDHLSFVLNFVVAEHILLKNHVLLVYMEVNFKWQIFLAV